MKSLQIAIEFLVELIDLFIHIFCIDFTVMTEGLLDEDHALVLIILCIHTYILQIQTY